MPELELSAHAESVVSSAEAVLLSRIQLLECPTESAVDGSSPNGDMELLALESFPGVGVATTGGSSGGVRASGGIVISSVGAWRPQVVPVARLAVARSPRIIRDRT